MDAAEIASVVGDQTFDGQIDLPDQQSLRKFLDGTTQHCDDVVDLRQVRRIERDQRFMRRPALTVTRVRGIVAKPAVLDQMPDHVDTKTIDPLSHPEAKYLAHGFRDFGISPVQVGLRSQKRVVIILARSLVELPGAAAELGEPVVGSAASRGWVAPDVPISLRTAPRPAAF